MFTGELQCIHALGFLVVQDVRDVASCQIMAMAMEKQSRFLPASDFYVVETLHGFLIWVPSCENSIRIEKSPSMNMPNWLVHLFGLFNGGFVNFGMT